jgi:DNA-binding transcriptional ArsR family regulator
VALTPGAPYGAKGDGFAPEVEFSVSSGTYSGALEVQLSPSTNAPVPVRTVIRYTVDGSMPTETSPVYSTPLRFTNLAVRLRARAFTGGLLPGELRGETYLPLTTTLANFRSDLPVMLIHDFGQGRPPANTRVFAHMQLYEPDTNGVTRLTRAPALATRAGISVRGSSTEGIPKASYRVEFRDEWDNDRPLSPLGMPADGDWVMYAPNFFEPVLIHNPFMHQLSRDIGRYSPNARFVEVYFVGSGTGAIDSSSYAGIYVLMDRIEVGKDRVDAGSLEPENLTLPSLSGGYLMKIDRLDPGDSGVFAANQGVALVDPREDQLKLPARAAQLNYIRNYLTSFGNALYDNTRFTNPDRLLLLCQLSQGEKRVGELEEILGILQPTLSQQLTVLRDEELVTTRRDGKSIYYQIASPQALAVMNVLFEQFCGPQTGDNT